MVQGEYGFLLKDMAYYVKILFLLEEIDNFDKSLVELWKKHHNII